MAERAGPLARALRLWNTVRWLRPVQVWGRAWFLLHRPKPDLRPAPPLRARAAEWQRCAREPSQLGPTRFRFLGAERDIAGEGAPAWDRPDWPRLWRYNLHYFDDLAADDADSRAEWHRALIESWIAGTPAGQGTGWEPYPLSLRLVNWIKAAPLVRGGVVQSLAVQARWLTGRLEIHLLGNHLWANAKALVFAGTFFEGEEARAWRERGLAILRRELREQILPDGGHFERSPMYHALFLEDLLDLAQLAKVYPSVIPDADAKAWAETSRRMLRWLSVMTHPDGEIAFFNDATIGVAPNYVALSAYAAAVFGEQTSSALLSDIEMLPDSGYVRMRAGEATLIADVAPIGPDYFPAHAHADTLSFELSVREQRVFVNSGISTYDAGTARSFERGTSAHNTVVVDNCDSSEVWGSFRVARRARPLDIATGSDGGSVWLAASHDGYHRLPGRVTHRRTWCLSPMGLSVRDELTGVPRDAQAVYHLHPDISLDFLETELAQFHVDRGTWNRRFGHRAEAIRLTLPFDKTWKATAEFRWRLDSYAQDTSEPTGFRM